MPHFWRLELGLEDLSCWLADLIFWIWTAMEVETDVALWHTVNWKSVCLYDTTIFVHKNSFKNALVDTCRWANVFDQKCHEQRKNVTQCRIITLPASIHPNRPHTVKLQVGNSSLQVQVASRPATQVEKCGMFDLDHSSSLTCFTVYVKSKTFFSSWSPAKTDSRSAC